MKPPFKTFLQGADNLKHQTEVNLTWRKLNPQITEAVK
jgi:hypothetical protein